MPPIEYMEQSGDPWVYAVYLVGLVAFFALGLLFGLIEWLYNIYQGIRDGAFHQIACCWKKPEDGTRRSAIGCPCRAGESR